MVCMHTPKMDTNTTHAHTHTHICAGWLAGVQAAPKLRRHWHGSMQWRPKSSLTPTSSTWSKSCGHSCRWECVACGVPVAVENRFEGVSCLTSPAY